jgi:uncharacterized membrane protein HdeD (DUF308 family)
MRRDGRTDIVATRSAPTGTSFAARTPDQWGWLAAAGILGIIVGVIALFFPGLTILTAAFFLGIVLVVQGVVEIAAAIRAGSGAAGRWWLIAFGVLALVAGVLVVFHPGGGILVMVWGLILWFIIAGANDFTAAAVSRERRVWNIAMGVSLQPGGGAGPDRLARDGRRRSGPGHRAGLHLPRRRGARPGADDAPRRSVTSLRPPLEVRWPERGEPDDLAMRCPDAGIIGGGRVASVPAFFASGGATAMAAHHAEPEPDQRSDQCRHESEQPEWPREAPQEEEQRHALGVLDHEDDEQHHADERGDRPAADSEPSSSRGPASARSRALLDHQTANRSRRGTQFFSSVSCRALRVMSISYSPSISDVARAPGSAACRGLERPGITHSG